MARATRIALDIALVSIKYIRPAIQKLWKGSKDYIITTPVKRLVENPIVEKAECSLNNATDYLETKITMLRDRQIPKEIEYLKKEIENVKDKIKKDKESTSKTIKPAAATAWQYAKIEMVPPFTSGFFNGAAGRRIEQIVSSTANSVISTLENTIREMDAEEARQKRLKVEAARAAAEKIKAEAKLAKEKAKQKAEQEKKAKAAKALETKKDETPSPPPKAKPPKKKPPSAKDKKKPKRGGKK